MAGGEDCAETANRPVREFMRPPFPVVDLLREFYAERLQPGLPGLPAPPEHLPPVQDARHAFNCLSKDSALALWHITLIWKLRTYYPSLFTGSKDSSRPASLLSFSTLAFDSFSILLESFTSLIPSS